MPLKSLFSRFGGSGKTSQPVNGTMETGAVEHHVRIVVSDFGPANRWDFEDRIVGLVEAVPGSEFDGTGTDLTTGEFELFMYGSDSDALVAALTPFLLEQQAAGVRVTMYKRPGPVELGLTKVDLG